MNDTHPAHLSTAEILQRWRNLPAIGGDKYQADLDAILDFELVDPFTRTTVDEDPRD